MGHFDLNISDVDGDQAYKLAKEFLYDEEFEKAGELFWQAVVKGGSEFKVEEAFQMYIKTFEERGIPEGGYIEVANRYILQRQISPAISYLEQALKLNPKSAEAHILLGSNLEGKDEQILQHRAQHLMTAIQLEPNNSKAYKGMAYLYWDASNWKDSMIYFTKTYELDTRDIDSHSAAIYLRLYTCN
eukprot:gene15574-32901_t